MADVVIEDRGIALVPGAHRAVRTLDPTEGPFAGALVTRGDGVAVRVDATALAGWVGWRFAGAEHVAGPIDVVRRSDGHDVLLPWCTDRVLGFLVRRTAAGSLLSSGECSTLVASLLRGLDELGEVAEGVPPGVWWLSDDGRPTFVIGEGEDARAGVASIIERLVEDCADKALKRVLATVQQGVAKALSQPRVPRPLLEKWEQEMLSVAAPRPLVRENFAPERAREVARAVISAHGQTVPAPRRRRADSPPSRRQVPLLQWLVERVTACGHTAVASGRRLGARRRSHVGRPSVSGTPTRRARRRPPLRRRVVLIAGAAAAVVLAGGLLWPGESPGQAAGDDHPSRPSPAPGEGDPPTSGTTPSVDPDGDAGESEDDVAEEQKASSVEASGPEAAVSALLARIAECAAAEDTSCAGAVAAGSTGVVEALAVAVVGKPTADLVDEYGDVAVIRIRASEDSSDEGDSTPAAGPEQMLVLVRQDEKWLVRDVYGVADQPG
ncbi:hypothetical protein [Microbacterium sp. PMB16]|uniref:hypothetical protein n=1 Tax=Microbacterium sp. PMB16 TaxID=3120157 RepID=UPI003F4B3551